MPNKYRRVLLKMGGEFLTGDDARYGIDPRAAQRTEITCKTSRLRQPIPARRVVGGVTDPAMPQLLQMFERAMKMFSPFAMQSGASTSESETKPNGAGHAAPKQSEEINELKSEIEAMRRQLSELAQRKD